MTIPQVWNIPWQDIVLMLGGFVFAPALLASILRRTTYPVWTSLPTAIVLTLFAAVYLSLRLYLAAFSTTLTAVCWYILFMRR